MKYLLTILMLMVDIAAYSQPIQRNWATTNSNPVTAIANGGTGASSAAGAASNVGNLFLPQTGNMGIWTLNATASYPGQLIVNKPGNVLHVAIAGSTTSNDWQSPWVLPFGVQQIGSPRAMQPFFNYTSMTFGGNPMDQTNSGQDSGLFLYCPNSFGSGASVGFPWTGTNLAFGNSFNWPDGINTTTNAAGQISYVHDQLMSQIVTVPDGSIDGDSPNQCIWVANTHGVFGTTNVLPTQVIMVNSPKHGLTDGNYPAAGVNPITHSFDIGLWTDKAYNYRSNNYKFSASFDLFGGNTTLGGSVSIPAGSGYTTQDGAFLSAVGVSSPGTLSFGQDGDFNTPPGPSSLHPLLFWLGDATFGASVSWATNVTLDANGGLITSALTVGNATNTPTGTLIRTNFVSGELYTNIYGRPIAVQAEVGLSVSGIQTAGISLLASLYMTNTVTLSMNTNVSMATSGQISMYIPPNQTYTFTNTSSGGALAGISNGQILVQ